jgi:hypothetical protein
MQPRSLYISHAVSHFFETGFEIWAGFGPVSKGHLFLFNHFIDMTINLNGSNFCRKTTTLVGKCQAPSVIFRPWNSLKAKNLNYKTYVYQTIIQYYRNNSSKDQIDFLLSIFFQY